MIIKAYSSLLFPSLYLHLSLHPSISLLFFIPQYQALRCSLVCQSNISHILTLSYPILSYLILFSSLSIFPHSRMSNSPWMTESTKEPCGRWNWIPDLQRRNKKTLHWFRTFSWRVFHKKLNNLEFGILFFSFHSLPLLSFYRRNESVEFVSLEELSETRVKSIEGEASFEW